MSYFNCFIKKPVNEPILGYAPNSIERQLVEKELEILENQILEIPLIINGEEIFTEEKKDCIIPHNHQKVIGRYSIATEEHVTMAIDAALNAKCQWEALPWPQKASIFLKAAELLSTTWRYKMNAATMLCQSKNVFQSEIDAVCELIDFFRFNAYFLNEIYSEDVISTSDTWNKIGFTGLDGFVYAVSPFNFTSIGGNLAAAPAMCGNTVVWKPASTAVYSNYLIMKLLEEAGLPKGVVNFIPGKASQITDIIVDHRDFAGFHYTGSTEVFSGIWSKIGNNINKYRSYPRIVGETGGKNFVFAHKSAKVDALVTALVRGAFEYQGQKCSAASRTYIPTELWPEVKEKLVAMTQTIEMGDVLEFKNFVNAVIDERAFDKISAYIQRAKESPNAKIITGGGFSKEKGYYIEPTIILTDQYDYETMKEEIFGPVLTIYVYDSNKFDEMLEICDQTSPYALTGAIWAQDRQILEKMHGVLKSTAGNFYINDKPTGAVVGQQPFGGGRASGTNDKAGSKFNLLRWVNTRTVKENFIPPTSYEYPFMG